MSQNSHKIPEEPLLKDILEEVSIIFENSHLLVLNKPAGLVVHSDGKTNEPTLVDWVLDYYPDMKGVGEPMILNKGTEKELVIDRPGVVHRLDRETSGVIVFAKHQKSFEHLKKQFQEREIRKTYRTVVWGLVKSDTGVVDRPIGRSKSDFRKWSAERFARGELRTAVTEYKVLQRITDISPGISETSQQRKIAHQFTYLEAYPKTGRTHQIRVHLKAINHPVVADRLYAENHPKVLGFTRTALHAYQIHIEDLDGIKHVCTAPLPQDFMEFERMLMG
jgi:23S rRNA pseudouridine1911/1915/1917 synthase